MKTQMKVLLAFSVLCAGSAGWFALSPSAMPDPSDVTLPAALRVSASPIGGVAEGAFAAADEASGDEPASLQAWQAAYTALLKSSGSTEAARASLVAELDEKYCEWIHTRLAALAKLDPLDRYEVLSKMESRLQAVSESVLGHLGIAGANHLGRLARSLEAITAEIEYAELPGTHAARVAMLRLDREREARFQQLAAARESDVEAQALAEITPWYEARLREIVGGDQPE